MSIIKRAVLIAAGCLICNLYASKVSVSDGTEYNGTIISENEKFLTLQTSSASIQILRSMILAIDGKPVVNSQAKVQESRGNATVNSPQAIPDNQQITIICKNGSVFKGVKTKENERLVVLDVDGTPVNIFKNAIAEIKVSDNKSGEFTTKKSETASVLQPSRPLNVASTDKNNSSSAQKNSPAIASGRMAPITSKKPTETLAEPKQNQTGSHKPEIKGAESIEIPGQTEKPRVQIVTFTDVPEENVTVADNRPASVQPASNRGVSSGKPAESASVVAKVNSSTISTVEEKTGNSAAVNALPAKKMAIRVQSLDESGSNDVSISSESNTAAVQKEIPVSESKQGSGSPSAGNAAKNLESAKSPVNGESTITLQKLPAPEKGTLAVESPDTARSVARPAVAIQTIDNEEVHTFSAKPGIITETAEKPGITKEEKYNAPKETVQPDVKADTLKDNLPGTVAASEKRDTTNSKPIGNQNSNKPVQKSETRRVENVSARSYQKIPGGMAEIVLKNGTVFKGKISSENERTVEIESDGATISILKKLIKLIDGKVYDKYTYTLKRDSLNLKQAVLLTIDERNGFDQRVFPFTEIPASMTIRNCVDSLFSKSWVERSTAARMIASAKQWGCEVIGALERILQDSVMNTMYEPVWIDSSNFQLLLSPGSEAARTLARMGDTGISVLKAALKSSDPVVRRRAAFGIGEFASDKNCTILLSALKDSSHAVRAVAVSGLRNAMYSEILIKMLKDPDSDVRVNAAFILGKLKEEKAINGLMELLYDKRSIVRAQSAEALGTIGGSAALHPLINALRDQDRNVRENAAYSLGEAGDTAAVMPLISLLKDKEKDIRLAALIALSIIRDPRAVPFLYSLLNDEEIQVRNQASLSLKKHIEIPLLIDALEDKRPLVRENAAYMLWLITGQDIGIDKDAWSTWYNQNK